MVQRLAETGSFTFGGITFKVSGTPDGDSFSLLRILMLVTTKHFVCPDCKQAGTEVIDRYDGYLI